MSELELKPFRSFTEQIDLLKKRNLEISEDYEEFAVSVLKRVNYYRFTAYLLPYKKPDDTYINGTSFQEIYKIYEFDRRIRNITTTLLEYIEISFRTYIAYTHAKRYGPDGYLNECNFMNIENRKTGEKFHDEFCEILRKTKDNNKNRLFVKHHKSKYHGIMPIWVTTEILTFANISRLYANLFPKDKGYIKREFMPVNVDIVENWLEGLTGLRNACAHSHRIYNEKFMIIKVMKRYHNNNIDGRRFFAYILSMKHLSNAGKEWELFYTALQELIDIHNRYIDLSLLGFPENWKDILAED